jgi:hypothetical protein
MTEIPLMPSEAPVGPSEKRVACGKPIIAIVVIVIVAFAALVAINLMGNVGQSYSSSTRDIDSYNNTDIDLSTVSYYRSEFDVQTYEVETPYVPELLMDIAIDHTGSDSVTVTIHIAVYETTAAVVDAAATWGELDSYLVGENDYIGSVYSSIALYDYATTYTWVVWFDASDKTSVWSVDIDITMDYYYYN